MIEADAIERIERLVQDKQVIEHNGEKFVPINYKVLRNVDRTPCVNLNTLKSLVDFVNENKQGLDLHGAIAVINGDLSVYVVSRPSLIDAERAPIVSAKNVPQAFEFDKFIPAELFNILIQTRFVYNEEAQYLFSITSRLNIDEGVELADDGTTQRVTIKKGMSAASMIGVQMPARIALGPYRIFPECPQPVSDFLIRFKGSKEEGAYVGLWETDGGMWKVQAKKLITDKLVELGLTIPIYS
jgi:hypothetical protein